MWPPPQCPFDRTFHLFPGTVSPRGKLYLAAGLIQPFSPPAGAGFSFIWKKNCLLHPCIDFTILTTLRSRTIILYHESHLCLCTASGPLCVHARSWQCLLLLPSRGCWTLSWLLCPQVEKMSQQVHSGLKCFCSLNLSFWVTKIYLFLFIYLLNSPVTVFIALLASDY